MKNLFFLLVVLFGLISCNSNKHVRFVNGTAVSSFIIGTDAIMQLDTTGNGVADIKAYLIDDALLFSSYKKGDTLSVDIGTNFNFASPIIKKSK